MSMFGIRKRLKSGLKSVLGFQAEEQENFTDKSWSAPSETYQHQEAAPVEQPQNESQQDTETVSADSTASVSTEASTVPTEPAPSVESASPETASEKTPASTQEESTDEAKKVFAPQEDDVVGLPLTMEAVQEILDDMVRPALQGDGGDISLVKIEDNNIYVQLVGACSTCPSSIMTMKMGVEALLKEEFPTMNELVDVTSVETAE